MLYEFRTKCDLSEMNVTVLFNKKFEGILYAEGYSHDPHCRTWGSNLKNVKRKQTLHLPLIGCGSRIEVKENASTVLNTIIVQHHRFLPTEFDMDYEVECALPERIASDFHSLFNTTNFEENGNTTKIGTSLEINSGTTVLGKKLAKRLKVEDKLLLAFMVTDDGQHNDLKVRECVAHNDAAINHISSVIQLTNSDRCSLGRSKYLSRFQVVASKTTIMAFAQLKSMEFTAHNRQLYITCEAELCEKWCKCNRRNRTPKGLTFTARHKVLKRSIDDTQNPPLVKRELGEKSESTSNRSSVKKFGSRNRLLLSTVRVLTDRFMQLKKQSNLRNSTRLNRRVSEDERVSHQKDQLNSVKEVAIENNQNELNAITTESITESNLEDVSNGINEKTVTEANESNTFNEILKKNVEDLSNPIYDEPIEECTTKTIVTVSNVIDMKVLVFNKSENDYEVDVLVPTDNNNTAEQFSETILEKSTDGMINEDMTNGSISNENDFDADEDFKIPDALGVNITSINVNVQENCVPNLRFLTVSLSLGFIIACLLLVILGMYLYIQKERKKHALSSYLLYSYH